MKTRNQVQGNSKIYTPSQPSEFAAEFQGFATPSHLKVYCTCICIIIGVCENACRMVLELLQFITQRFTTVTPYHAAIVKVQLDNKAVGGKQWLMRFIVPIPDAIFLDKGSTWFSHVRFSSISMPRDLVQWECLIGTFFIFKESREGRLLSFCL